MRWSARCGAACRSSGPYVPYCCVAWRFPSESRIPQGAHMSGKSRLDDKQYEELLKPLATELSAMARWVSETRQRMVVVFEGRDTAGKGGSIEMFARVLNPRQCRIAALPSPNERERTQSYFQRYVEHFPA